MYTLLSASFQLIFLLNHGHESRAQQQPEKRDRKQTLILNNNDIEQHAESTVPAQATTSGGTTWTKEGQDNSMLFRCPVGNKQNQDNAKAQNHVDHYWNVYREMDHQMLEEIGNFRHQPYDYRTATFSEMKQLARPFKTKYFGEIAFQRHPHTSSSSRGDGFRHDMNDQPPEEKDPTRHWNLYESACGQGLNLLLTLEILYECCGIDNLTIHGNDYVPESLYVAQKIYRHEQENYTLMENRYRQQQLQQQRQIEPQSFAAERPWFNVGTFCQGDSTNLSFVPENSMDVAYTGSIDPIMTFAFRRLQEQTASDQMEIILADNDLFEQAIEHVLNSLCESRDPQDILLAEQMQNEQEQWHAKWVRELIRITKPGHYIIIEDVGYPVCKSESEWGGVDAQWWYGAVEEYQWGNVTVVEVVQEYPFKWYRGRYNVILQKGMTAASSVPPKGGDVNQLISKKTEGYDSKEQVVSDEKVKIQSKSDFNDETRMNTMQMDEHDEM